MRKRKLFLACLLATSLSMLADNTNQTVKEVTTPITLGEEVDYHITSTTPFATTGSINITNTETAAVIFDNLIPSKASEYLNHITINGAAAVQGKNCQLRIYNAGAMVLPYSGAKPLTVFTGDSFTGESSDAFDVNTIYGLSSNNTLNNKIKSFILKRGFMVCFATSNDGTGYSRVFVADKADKKINLPTESKPLNGRISFIRISKWNDVHKRGWAGFWNNETQELLNTSWAYNWDASTHNDWVDREYVTQHHHEGWPGIADVGNNSGSANILGNNEPDNKADDKEQDIDVKNVLANWPKMMATGRRLGSPAVSGNYNWLYEFIDSIDARGWRCDFIAVHAYWYKDKAGWESQLKSISQRCGNRPIWITEMNYGANWTGWPGSNTSASDANYAIELQHMGPVLDYLNDAPYIERYAFYNNVQDCRYAIANGKLTPIGEKYANLTPKMAYNSAYEYVPKNPKTYKPSDFTLSFVPRSSTCVLSWKNHNGEFVDEMNVQRKKTDGEWENIASVEALEDTSKVYSYNDNVAEAGDYTYRIQVKTYLGNLLCSAELKNTINGSEGTTDFQWGSMSAASDEEIYNFYEHGFESSPAVVFGGNGGVNATTRSVETVNAVTTTYFRSKFFPWNAQDNDKNDFSKGAETSSFIVAKSGNGMIGSLHYEVGYITDENGSNKRVGGDAIEYKFKQPFSETPVVFATPFSSLKYPVVARVFDITKDGFKIVLNRQYGASKFAAAIVAQRVAFFAIEKGKTTAFGKKFMVNSNDFLFKYSTTANSIEFGEKLKNINFFAQYQTFNRKVMSLVRLGNDGLLPTGTKLKVAIDSSDPDGVLNTKNPISENIAWMTISDGDEETGINGTVTSESSDLDINVAGGLVKIRDGKASSVRVYTISGALVASASLKAGEAILDLNVLPEGVLVFKANSGKFTKLVIRR